MLHARYYFSAFMLGTYQTNIVPNQVDKNAHKMSLSKSLRGTLFKPRRRHLVLLALDTAVHTNYQQELVPWVYISNAAQLPQKFFVFDGVFMLHM